MSPDDNAPRLFGSTGPDVFRRILAAMPVGLLLLDERDTIHYANGAAASILGGHPEGLIGSTFGSREADGKIIEAWDVETGHRSARPPSEATVAGCSQTRIMMLRDEPGAMALRNTGLTAREAAAAITNLQAAAEAAVAELAGIPGSESAATRLRHAVSDSAAIVRELFPVDALTRTPEERQCGSQSSVSRGAPAPERDGSGARRVLVVDDDGAVARITARALVTLGVEAVARNTVEGAISLLESESVETVLVDAMMPGPGIEQVCRDVRRLCPEARLVVMSGADTVADLVRDLSDGFLAKPFSIGELRGLFDETVQQVLRRAA